MSWFRIITGVLAFSGTVFGIARGAARNQVDKSVAKIISEASELTRARVKTRASSYLRDAWRSFVVITMAKVVSLLILIALKFIGTIDRHAFVGMLSIFVALSLIYDIHQRRHSIANIYRLIRRHGPRPKKIVKLTVARHVFDEVLTAYGGQKASRIRTALIRLGGHTLDDLGQQVAKAVSVTASETAWNDIAPFARTAIMRFFILFCTYSLFVTFIFWQIPDTLT